MTPVEMRRVFKVIDERAVEDENGCWLWTGRRDRYGYAEIKYSGRHSVSLHRLSWMAHRGPIPEGLVIDHLCRVRHCVNPWHMEPVTVQVNTQRSPLVGKTRLAVAGGPSAVCRNDHQRTAENTRFSVSKAGYRVTVCRICERDRQVAFKARRAA